MMINFRQLPWRLRLGLIVLGLIILFGATWYWSRRTTPQPSPASQKRVAPALQQQLTTRLPYTTANFSVDYLKSADTFTVEIYAEPIEAVKDQAKNYLSGLGVDLKSAKIDFYLLPGLGQTVGP